MVLLVVEAGRFFCGGTLSVATGSREAGRIVEQSLGFRKTRRVHRPSEIRRHRAS